MKNYEDLSLRCRSNRCIKIAEEIGRDCWFVWEDYLRAEVTLSRPVPDPGKVRLLRASILLHAAWVKNERWERLLGE